MNINLNRGYTHSFKSVTIHSEQQWNYWLSEKVNTHSYEENMYSKHCWTITLPEEWPFTFAKEVCFFAPCRSDQSLIHRSEYSFFMKGIAFYVAFMGSFTKSHVLKHAMKIDTSMVNIEFVRQTPNNVFPILLSNIILLCGPVY